MSVRFISVLIISAVLCSVAAATLPKYQRFTPPAPRDENAVIQVPANVAELAHIPSRGSLDDPIGRVDTAGTTWWDEMQYTTFGKAIAVDRDGYVHHVWTKGSDASSAQRHIVYNVWSPEDDGFSLPSPSNPIGVLVESTYRAGYATVAVNSEGFAFPAFHAQAASGATPHAAVGLDLFPRLGGFTIWEIPFPEDRRIVYPKIVCDTAGIVQVTATQGIPYNVGFYAHGLPHYTDGAGDSISWPEGFVTADSTFYLTRDIAASFRSNRLAMAWLFFDSRLWLGLNLFVKTSQEGGVDWGEPINITNYPPIDTNCVSQGGEIDSCNQDTLRPGHDLSVIFDQDDVVHVAFTARGYYYWDESGSVGPWIHVDGASSIWHWDEQHQEFNIVAERDFGTLEHSLGLVQAMCQRPSLAVDTTNGFLYCSYQVYDTNQWSEAGYLQSDAWVSVSTTGGRTWSEGTNVTASYGGQNTPAGQCFSERDINLAQFVTDGIVHMQYELDRDAGTGINSNPEGVPTLNPILYQRIPADQIPTRPLINPYRILRMDSTGYPFGLDTTLAVGEPRRLLPGEFTLYQNYPNPFNPSTTIQFDLAVNSRVSLRVFDVLGREAAVLANNELLTAGVHVIAFDGSELTSGVYFCRLESAGRTQTRKMILMR